MPEALNEPLALNDGGYLNLKMLKGEEKKKDLTCTKK